MNNELLLPLYPPIFKIKEGDFGCTENPMALGKGINAVSSMYSSDRHSKYTHTFMIINSWGETFESDWRVTSYCLFKKYEGKPLLIARPIDSTEEEKTKAIGKIALEHANQFYPIHRLFLHIFNLAHIFHWKRLVCSELTAKYLFYLGQRHHHYFGTTPDNIADEIKCALNNDRTGPKYKIIFEGILPIFRYFYCPHCKIPIFTASTQNVCPKCLFRYLEPIEQLKKEFFGKEIQYNKSKEVNYDEYLKLKYKY